MKRLRLVILVIMASVVIFVVWRGTIKPPGTEAVEEDSGPKVTDVNEVSDANEVAADANVPVDVNEPNEPNEPGEPNEAGEPNEPNEPMEALNLKDVEMKNIVGKLAEWTGKVIIPHDEAMKQKITIYSAEKLPKDQALFHIYSALHAKGFVAEQTDSVIYIKPITEARLGSVPTIPDSQPLASIENKSQVVQKFFKLRNYNPTQMSEIILPLVGEYGYVSADENTGNILVIDTVENLMRIERIISQFDVPEYEQTVTEVFELRHGDAGEIVQLLRLLLSEGDTRSRGRRGRPSGPRGGSSPQGGSGKGTGAATSVVIGSTRTPVVLIPEPRRKWIIAKASAEDMKQIAEWIEKLDKGEKIESEYETIQITYADVREVAGRINDAIQKMPGTELKTSVLVQPLSQARQIMIFGRAEMREMIKKLIEEVDIPTGEFETKVFKLKHADPEQIKSNIDELYGANVSRYDSYSYYRYGPGSRRTPADEVKAIAFPTMKQVTVIASPENIVRIAEQIEEWDVPINVNEVKPRIVTLHNSDPVQMADLLSELFSETEERFSFWDLYYGGGQDKEKIVGPLYGQLTFEAVPDTKKIIIISNIAEAYDVVEELIRDLDKEEMAEVPSVITLNYADPEDLAERLNAIFNEPGTSVRIRVGETGLSEYSMEETEDNQDRGGEESSSQQGGTYTPWWTAGRRAQNEMPISNVIGRIRFIPDPRTKCILVLAPPEFMKNIEKMIKQLDTPGKQVMVKAIIVEVDHRNLTSLGLQLSSNRFAFEPIEENTVTALGQLTLLEEHGSLTFSASTDITAMIDFLQEKTNAKILNQQTLWTEDNEEADFFKGKNVAFVEDVSISETGGRVTSGVKFKRVGMTLRVRPSITPESNVDMIVNVIISQLTGDFINDQPVRAEMETTTNMIVKDGQTIMLGGILFQEESIVERKLPLLGDAPLVGGLFRHNDTTEVNNEMLVFITPYVIDEAERMLPETTEILDTAKEKLKNVQGQLEFTVEKIEQESIDKPADETTD